MSSRYSSVYPIQQAMQLFVISILYGTKLTDWFDVKEGVSIIKIYLIVSV
jgi:hypothetical protein